MRPIFGVEPEFGSPSATRRKNREIQATIAITSSKTGLCRTFCPLGNFVISYRCTKKTLQFVSRHCQCFLNMKLAGSLPGEKVACHKHLRVGIGLESAAKGRQVDDVHSGSALSLTSCAVYYFFEVCRILSQIVLHGHPVLGCLISRQYRYFFLFSLESRCLKPLPGR